MAPEDQDAAYLWDMREAAKEAVSILSDKSVETFAARQGERSEGA